MTMKEKLAERWRGNRISEAMLRIYVIKGIIILFAIYVGTEKKKARS